MSGRIHWGGPIVGSDTCGYSFIQGRYTIWLHTQKFEIGFRIVLYSHKVTDVKLSIAPDKVGSIYDAERCSTVEQAMQVCEDALSEILQGAPVIIGELIAEQDALIHEISDNLAIDVDDPERTDSCKQEAMCELQNLISKQDIWRKELNKLEKATRRDG